METRRCRRGGCGWRNDGCSWGMSFWFWREGISKSGEGGIIYSLDYGVNMGIFYLIV